VGAGVVPVDCCPSLTGPRLTSGRDCLQRPLANQRLELHQRLFRGWLIHPCLLNPVLSSAGSMLSCLSGIPLLDDLAEAVLDDAVRSGLLQFRHYDANEALIDNRVHGHPVWVGQ
jgi:hypothetical protein